MMKQKGFTLLELLVVVTILAILAASALVAYDGLSDSAIDAADANNISTLDQAIRTYKVAERQLPNQFDSLLDAAGSSIVALDNLLAVRLAALPAGNSTVSAIEDAFVTAQNGEEFEVQVISSVNNTAAILDGATGGVNAAFNEASGLSTEGEIDDIGIAVLANTVSGTVSGASITNNLNGVAVTNGGAYLNSINDAYENGDSHLVVALGFGGDAAHSTTDSPAAIAAAPASSATLKTKYSRYIALFHVAEDENGDNNITDDEVHSEPHFIGLITPQGKTLTTLLREQKGAD